MKKTTPMIPLFLLFALSSSVVHAEPCANLSGKYRYDASACQVKLREGFKTPAEYGEMMDPLPIAFEKGSMKSGFSHLKDQSTFEIVQKGCDSIQINYTNQDGVSVTRNSSESFGPNFEYQVRSNQGGFKWMARVQAAGCQIGLCTLGFDRATATLEKNPDGSLTYKNNRRDFDVFGYNTSMKAKCTFKAL